jgi:hypothetical protein
MRGSMRAVVVVLLLVAVAGWAGAKNETWFRAHDGQERVLAEYRIRVRVNAGTTDVTLTRPNDVVYALLKNGSVYTNPTSGVDVGAVGEAVAAAFQAQGQVVPMSYEATGPVVNASSPRVLLAEYSAGSVGLTGEQKGWLGANAAELRLSWPSSDQSRECVLWLVKTNGKAARIGFEVIAEMFEGEQELFARVGGAYSYEQKALALLARALAGASDFRSLVGGALGYGAGAGFGSMSAGGTVAGADAATAALKRALAQHFAYYAGKGVERAGQEVALPYLEFPSGTFERVYGGARQIYVMGYLSYLYKKGKPVLSYLIQEELSGNPGVMEGTGGYDWGNYEPIGVGEGRELATAALRYLTWGVEYTQYGGQNSVSVEETAHRVVGTYEERIREWTHENVGVRTATENYLGPRLGLGDVGTGGSEGGEIRRVHRLEAGFRGKKLTLVAVRPDSGQALAVSRIDLLTSRNIAWDTGRVVEVVHAGAVDNGQGASLRDGKLYAGNNTENLRLGRGAAAEVSYGYRFGRRERVGGLIVVNGEGVAPALAKGEYRSEQRFVVQYQESFGGPWREYRIGGRAGNAYRGDASRYREFAYDYRTSGYVEHTENPGWGVANGQYYTQDAQGLKQVGYVYVVFPEGIDCYGIQVVDRTGNDTVTVSELMVFEGSPVDYLLAAEQVIDVEGAREVPLSKVFAGGAAGVGTRPSGVWSAGGQGAVQLVSNGAMGRSYGLGYEADMGRVEVSFTGEVSLEQIVVWEGGHASGEPSVLEGEMLVFGGTAELLDSGYFQVRTPATESVGPKLRTPFAGADLPVLRGNPLPYAAEGIDSPRTFNYKMIEQLDARRWYQARVPGERDRFTDEATTLALDEGERQESYREGYVSQADLVRGQDGTVDRSLTASYGFRDAGASAVRGEYEWKAGETKAVKPYLPGMLITTARGVSLDPKSPYTVDKIAGVDSLGMLMGSVAMTDSLRERVYDAFNRRSAAELDKYYRMEGTGAGLGADGKPVFFADAAAQSYLSGAYRWTEGDFERSTVLVPDMHEMQEGDLVVRYRRDGEPHVGIVVGFLGDKPVYGADGSEFLSKVLVVSVRRGFRTVTLGTWGNAGNTFGGFTVEPEMYQVRRLLKLKAGLAGPGAAKRGADGWEVVQKVPLRLRDYYPPDVPTWRYISHLGEVSNLVTQDWRFERYLPPTAYDNKASPMIADYRGGSLVPIEMYFTQSSGWRIVASNSYHPAVDIGVAGGALDKDITAPEDGVFSFVDAEELGVLPLPDGSEINLDQGFQHPASARGTPFTLGGNSYTLATYGVLGVLVANPGEPQLGRIYLYAHQGRQGQSRAQILADLQTRYDTMYPAGADPRAGTMPRIVPGESPQWTAVVAGEWIGRVGNAGFGAGAHVHLEVFEYYERTSLGESLEAWRRVNAASLFEPDDWSTGWASGGHEDSPHHVEELLKDWIEAEDVDVEAADYFRPWAYP